MPKLRFPEFKNAEGWKNHFGDSLFDQISDRNPGPGLPVLAITQEHGAIPRHMINYHVSVTEKSIESYKIVQVGDFIISLRSFQGGIEYSQYHGICSPAYVVLRRRVDGHDAYFKHYLKTDKFIQILIRNLEGLRDGKMISYKQFSELLLSVPVPAEQQKIADCLSSLDELIAAQASKVDALKTYKKGLMQQLFPREGETQPRLRFPEFQSSDEWTSASLGTIFKTSSGGTPDRSTVEYWNGDIPWITTSLVGFNIVTEVDQFITEAGLNSSSAKVFPEMTILIAMYGQGKTRGQVAMLGIKAATNQACAAILPTEEIDSRFVFLNLCSRYDELRGLSNSGGQENLSQGLIQGLPFSYPKDRSEQQRIADCLTSLDDQIDAQAQALEALKTHKKGLMQQLFPSAEDIAP
ncbi:restriction endonuclease subunit S [Polaromonas sp.]|uniref:restriction endonuclease subunit S n=1 Tax=Polaromonas sp. TaxID=1869339 RepID=UPI003BB6F15E